jgi:hypothetical protein
MEAEFVCELAGWDGIEGWRFQCPACQATWDEDFDARGKEVACEHCQWKGKAGT